MNYVKRNIISSLILQLVCIVTGFVLPKMYIQTYGSEANGLIQMISQYLTLIGFLEMGIGAVIKSSFYEPLAQNDANKLNEIASSASKFFKKLTLIFIVYTIFLVLFNSKLVNTSFSPYMTITLILAISLRNYMYSFFGIINRLLLEADQRMYIISFCDFFSELLNLGLSVYLMSKGVQLQIVVLVSAFIKMITPIAAIIYTKKKYNINMKVQKESK